MLINKPFNFPTFINFSQQFQFAYDIDTNDEYSIERYIHVSDGSVRPRSIAFFFNSL